mmetsp:Transcript_10310/g.18757  ORF Transcript_10310/g.18757 Transcript_10310/m.18757 type:complete len:292 (-) Transcript_10310:172-1047(-)
MVWSSIHLTANHDGSTACLQHADLFSAVGAGAVEQGDIGRHFSHRCFSSPATYSGTRSPRRSRCSCSPTECPAAIAWNSFLITGMAGSTLYLFWLSHKEKLPTPSEHNWAFFIALLTGQSTTGVMDSSLSKLFVLTEDGLLGSVIALWIIVNLLMNYTFIIQATTVKQSYFVPASSSIKILLNAITGCILWQQDWKVISSWAGYITVFLLLALGNYLLSEHNIFAVGDGTAGAMSTAGRVGSIAVRQISAHYSGSRRSQLVHRSSSLHQHYAHRRTSLIDINSQWLAHRTP